MDISVEATALKADSDRSDQLSTASTSAEERRSDADFASTDVKLPENGEIVSENISDNFAVDGSVGSVKNNVSSLLSLVNDPLKSVEDKITPDSRDVERDGGRFHVDQVDGKIVDAASDSDDDGQIADSRSATPLQDELEPGDDLNENQGTSHAELDQSIVVNPLYDSNMGTKSLGIEATSAELQNESGEENGEISDDDEETTASVLQKLKPLTEGTLTEQLEALKEVFIVLSV